MGSLLNMRSLVSPSVRGNRLPTAGVLKKTAVVSRSRLGLSYSLQRGRDTCCRLPRTQLRSSYIDADTYGDENDEEILFESDEEEVDEMETIEEVLDTEDDLEDYLEEEEEADEEEADEEEEATIDADETEESTEEIPSQCPQGFTLNFLWLDKCIAVAVDQIFSKTKRSPLTEYFIWPRADAWEELRVRLQENSWIDERDQVLLLNRTTEVINFWQDEEKRHTLQEARSQFPDCVFMGA